MAQGTKRETGQQLRELQVEHGAALRQLASVQEAAARMQQKLKVRCTGMPRPQDLTVPSRQVICFYP